MLQAWNAADNLLLDTAATHGLSPGTVLVVNDEFGALSLPLAAACWTDSWLSAEAIRRNAARNEAVTPDATFLTSPPPGKAGAVLMHIPKQLALLEWQLAQLACHFPGGTPLFAAAMEKHLPQSALSLIQQYWGEASRHRAVGKARLLSATRRLEGIPDLPAMGGYECAELGVTLEAGPNVFSRDSLDIGSRFLLQFLKGDQAPAPVARCLDLACGNGVLGLAALHWKIARSVIFCDESSQAIDSARRNAAAIAPDAETTFCHGDGAAAYTGPPVELVLCNPPFHMGHSVDAFAGRRLLAQAAKVLQDGGELLAVTNRHLDYGPGLRRHFRRVERAAGNRKFTIWKAHV